MATLDELQAQLTALAQRVNEITAPPDDYYTHRFSGEEIDNAVGRVAATAGSGAITAGDVGAAPSGFGWGDTISMIIADSADESYETYCSKVEAVLTNMPRYTAKLVIAYPPMMSGKSISTISVLYKTDDAYAGLFNVGSLDISLCGWRMIKLRYPYSSSDPVWMPFEWVNPPLSLGVEYRTVERYQGKPVYVKLVNFGALPNNSGKMVEYAGGDTTTRIIEAHGVASSGHVIPGSTGSSGFPSQVLEIITNHTQVGVITHTDRSSLTAQIMVKYWRTSD